jgi:hypothetical protein
MQKHHSAQTYLLVQYIAWLNMWCRYGKTCKGIHASAHLVRPANIVHTLMRWLVKAASSQPKVKQAIDESFEMGFSAVGALGMAVLVH